MVDQEKDDAERMAATAVEALIEGATMEWRSHEEQSRQKGADHDFDLRLPDGTEAALEVTWSRDEDLAEQWEALENYGWRIEADDLDSSWQLGLEPDAHISTLHGRAVELLADLEREGVDGFSSNTPRHIFPVGPLRDLGVRSGTAFETSGGNAVYLTHGPGGGRVAGSVATEACQREAWEEDNREKLAKTGLAETHLFVLLHHGEAARVAMNLESPPATRPDLPPEIAHLWAAGKVINEERYVVWRGSRDEPWAELGEFEA